MEESEHSAGILQELVSAGYIDVYDDIAAAEAGIKDGPVVVSKMALITTTKDGVLKHRLILDCA